jgi:hypothetical protein
MSAPHCESAPAEPEGREEIEVTEEMIEAGVRVFMLGWTPTEARDAVVEIYLAMHKGRKVDNQCI